MALAHICLEAATSEKMNLQDPKGKPTTLKLELKCENSRTAKGMRQIIGEVLREYKYKRKDYIFELEKKYEKD